MTDLLVKSRLILSLREDSAIGFLERRMETIFAEKLCARYSEWS
jgi:hypothetical protein